MSLDGSLSAPEVLESESGSPLLQNISFTQQKQGGGNSIHQQKKTPPKKEGM